MKTILIKKSQGQVAHTDYYKKVAALKFGIAYEQVTPEMRATVKELEFHRMYAPTSSDQVFKSTSDVRRFFGVDYAKN